MQHSETKSTANSLNGHCARLLQIKVAVLRGQAAHLVVALGNTVAPLLAAMQHQKRARDIVAVRVRGARSDPKCAVLFARERLFDMVPASATIRTAGACAQMQGAAPQHSHALLSRHAGSSKARSATGPPCRPCAGSRAGCRTHAGARRLRRAACAAKAPTTGRAMHRHRPVSCARLARS